MHERIHVLHIITTIDRGGAENHLYSLVKHQRDIGWAVSVAYLKGAPYWKVKFEQLGVEVVGLGLRFYGDPKPLLKLIKECRRRSAAGGAQLVVHAHLPPAELYARLALACAHLECPFLVSRHNDAPFYRGPFAKALSRWVLKRAVRVIAISSAVAARVKSELSGVKHRVPEVETIPYGIGADWLPPRSDSLSLRKGGHGRSAAASAVRSALNIPNDALVVGTISRLVPQKALHLLIEGFSEFSSSSLSDGDKAAGAEFLVIVGRGSLKNDLESLAQRLGVGSQVRFVSFTDEVRATLESFDIFALTSLYEGFGLVLLEAMVCELSILATRVSSIGDIVENEQTGILVPPNNSGAIAKGLNALRSPEVRQRLGRAGGLRVKECFSEEVMCERLDRVYAGLFDGISGNGFPGGFPGGVVGGGSEQSVGNSERRRG